VSAFLMKRTIPMVLPVTIDPPKLTPQDVKKLEVAGG